MRRPGVRWSCAVVRPSVFQAGHTPSCRGSCECAASSLVAEACRWLLLSPLLSGGSGSLPVGRVGIVQVLPDGRDVVQSSGLQSLDHIAACQDDYRVPVFADFLLSLASR